MAIEAALYSYLTNHAAVKALIGSRLYPNVVPQDTTLPAVAYQVITATRSYHHQGQSAIATPRIQFTVEAASYSSANAVAAALRQALSGYRGYVGSVEICGAYLENEFDGYNLSTDLTTVRQDYRVDWRE
jgi:hypothetical protein